MTSKLTGSSSFLFQYHSKIQRLLTKYSCLNSGNSGKINQEKTIDGCSKSQSFYSGMNQLVQVANNSAVSTATTTSTTTAPMPGSPTDPARVRNCYYNCCTTPSCSNSPSASVASTVSLCPSHLLSNECPHRQVVRVHGLAPHLKVEHWLPPPPCREGLLPPLPAPYVYSSAYEVEAVSPDLSLEHIYSQIPSPQPPSKFSHRHPHPQQKM